MLLTNLFRLQSKLRLTLFLICSYFFSESEAHCSYKIVLKKKECMIKDKYNNDWLNPFKYAPRN